IDHAHVDGHVRLLDAAGDATEDAARGPADAADPAPSAGRSALELGHRARDQKLGALDLADGRLGAFLDPSGRATVLLSQDVPHVLALQTDVAVRMDERR